MDVLGKKVNAAIVTLGLLSPLALNAAPVLWTGDSGGSLATVDVATGVVNVVGNMGHVMTDIAFDPSGNLWGITFTDLYTIDKTTGASSHVGSLGTSLNSLVFSASGTLYSANNSLYSIDTTTGAANLIGNGGSSYASSGDLAFVGGQLHLSAGGGDNLVSLDTTTGFGTTIGSIGYSSVYGLASPDGSNLYGLSGFDVLSIDPLTGAGSLMLNYAGQGVNVAYGSAFLEEASEVPVPAAAWLFGSALLSLGGLRRAKKTS